MRKLILLLFFLSPCGLSWCQSVTLTPQAEVSIITCGPDDNELYAAFGHSAIRVYDPANRIDYAYNYGVFDFDQPNFYLNYTRGLLLFKLGVYSYPDFVNSYRYFNRWVTEQVLDLSQQQKQAVFDFLEWNALPENETYRYDYFYNNCANKVRDVFAQILGDSLRFDDSYIDTHYTIRQLTDLYLKDHPWGDLGIDICLGLPMDKPATPYDYMFLPDYVMHGFDHATVTRNGQVVPAVKAKIPAFVNTPSAPHPAPVHPWTAFGTLLAVALLLSIIDYRRKRLSLWFDAILFGTSGATGLLLLMLWTLTDHAAAANNFNLLWALPTNLAIFFAFFGRWKRATKKYFAAVGVLSLLLLAGWSLLPQQLNIFLIPLVAALMIRSFMVSRQLQATEPKAQS